MDNESLATELLREVKASAKRWFIAFLVVVGLEVATIVGFLWYISLPVEEVETEYQQEIDNLDNSKAMQMIGSKYDGESTDEEE